MEKFKVACILSVFVCIIMTGLNLVLAESDSERLELASKYYASKDYYSTIRILEQYYSDFQLSPYIADEVGITVGNMLGDCYWLTNQFNKAYLTFNFSAEIYYDSYSYYMSNCFLLMETFSIRSYKDYVPMTNDRIKLNIYDLFSAIIGALDHMDNTRPVSLRSIYDYFQGHNPMSLGWGYHLLEYYIGKCSAQTVMQNVPDQQLGSALFYIAAGYEISRKWEEAKKYYLESMQHDCFENILSKSRLGLIYIKYQKRLEDGNTIYTCSSSLSQLGKSLKKYPISNIIDADLSTAWVSSNDQLQMNEQWIKIDFTRRYVVSGFRMVNGYNKSSDLFRSNSRVKEFEIYFDDGSHVTVAIKDAMGQQTYRLPNKKTSTIKFVIKDVVNGIKYNDLCISELDVIVQ